MRDNAAIKRSLAALMLTPLLAAAGLLCPAVDALADSPHLIAQRSHKHPDILIMQWRGPVEKTMYGQIHDAFELNKATIRGIEFRLDSGGGSVSEGERVIALLQAIKKTHTLHTVVMAGRRCGSMCVFIYVQGGKRLAAPASLWLFHEVSHTNKKTRKITSLDRASWEQLVQKYWVPAGVNPAWIATVKTHTFGTDYWRSGDSLIRDGSNIIQKPISDEHKRKVFPSSPNKSAH